MKLRKLTTGRGLVVTLIVIACIAIIGTVIFSPFALTSIEPLSRNWNKLSSIGQTYGAISALISSLALGGVIVSLLYQARDGRTSREQSLRSVHHQLIRMEMEDPVLMKTMGAPWNLPIPAESESVREHLYIHMWVNFWAGLYVIGEMPPAAVRHFARNELFNGQAGRAYWAAVGKSMVDTSSGRYRRFVQLFDEEYREIISNNIPVATPIALTGHTDEGSTNRKNTLWQSALACAALIAGILIGRRLYWQSRGGP
jgi:Family of unknown function (DUF6082)